MRPSRRVRRHLLLAGTAVLLAGLLYLAFGAAPEVWLDPPTRKAESPIWRLSMALAYTALLFLGATLLIGPLRVLRGRPSPANQMTRRDVGIWAGLLALAHVTIAVQVHTEHLQLWYLFLTELPSAANPLPLRISKIGLANYLGLFQASLFVLLLLVSNNRALRRLGTRRWKRLQQLAYVAFGSVVAHGFLNQLAERRDGRIMLAFAAIVLTIGGGQLLGAWTVRRRQAQRQKPTDSKTSVKS